MGGGDVPPGRLYRAGWVDLVLNDDDGMGWSGMTIHRSRVTFGLIFSVLRNSSVTIRPALDKQTLPSITVPSQHPRPLVQTVTKYQPAAP